MEAQRGQQLAQGYPGGAVLHPRGLLLSLALNLYLIVPGTEFVEYA